MQKRAPSDIMRKILLPILGKGIVLEIVLAEISIIYYSLIVWFKKPQTPDVTFFTYHKDSQIKIVTIVFTVIITLELVALHFLISNWSQLLAWISVVLNIYGILYLIALNNSVRYLPHLLGSDTLLIRLGFQSSISIQLDNIESFGGAKPVELGAKVPKDMYVAYMRLDEPQFEIRLKQPMQMLGSYGTKKDITSVVMRVDNPQKFEAELKRLLV